MIGIAAIHAHMANQHAAACRRRRTAEAPFVFTGSSYLASDGSAGSYAEATTNAPARLIFTAANQLGVASIGMWVRCAVPGAGSYGMAGVAAASSGNPVGLMSLNSIGRIVWSVTDDAAGVQAPFQSASSDYNGVLWTLTVATVELTTSDIVSISRNSTFGEVVNTDASPDTFTAGEIFRLFSDRAGGSLLVGDIRSPFVIARRMSTTERTALTALGPTHDLREASGNYLGDVAHWWPADGDSGTTVTDRGLVGGCNLTLNGNVTIGAV